MRDVAGMKAPLPDKTEMMSVPLAFSNLISLIGSFHHGVQVRFKTTQVESGEVWALCLVRLWPRKNSTASV